jgi:hypothetical protein
VKILVFGSRGWIWEGVIFRVLSKLPRDTILVNGYAPGADRMADTIGRKMGLDVRSYPADWALGNSGGPIRNALMLTKEHPDQQGVGFDKGFGFSTGRQNKGTHDMAEKLWAARIRFEIVFPPEDPRDDD